MPSICVFEDDKYAKLLPLVHFRPVYGLRCGMTILLEKILRQYPRVALDLNCREYLVDTVKKSHLTAIINKLSSVSSCLFLNGRILAGADLSKKIPLNGPDEIFLKDDSCVAARLSGENLLSMRDKMASPITAGDLKHLEVDQKIVDVKLIEYPFDLISENHRVLADDIKTLAKLGSIKGKIHSGVQFYQKDMIYVDDRAAVMAGVVIDASQGPVYISKDAVVFPNTYIEGPVYIGEGSTVLGGRIKKGTSIGPSCKVCGEISETIIHGYSNKAHDGFMGHSYICEWVNIGAGTITSDLKNNYGRIKIWCDGTMVDSNQMFVGSFIADHAKIGIGSLLNAGTVIGVSANVFGGGMTAKHVPSFSWGGGMTEHNIEKAVETARVVMSRRDVEISSTEEALLRQVFNMTREERSPAAKQEEKDLI